MLVLGTSLLSQQQLVCSDRSHPDLCHDVLLLPSCISWAGHQSAAADADGHSAILWPFFYGGYSKGEKWGEMVFAKCQLPSPQISCKLLPSVSFKGQFCCERNTKLCNSLFFIRLKRRQKNSRKGKQIWTTMLRERLLHFVRSVNFSAMQSK